MEYHKGGKPAEGEPILPELDEMGLPKIEMSEFAAIFIGTIDAAKDRAKKEVLREVFQKLDELRGRDGCVAVDVVKRHLSGYFEI